MQIWNPTESEACKNKSRWESPKRKLVELDELSQWWCNLRSLHPGTMGEVCLRELAVLAYIAQACMGSHAQSAKEIFQFFVDMTTP